MDNKMYDSFYYIHIPKNGGRFFKYNITDPIYNICSKNNIKFLKDTQPEYSGPGHNQWPDSINDSTYIACTFRDSVKHAVSMYAHLQTLDNRGEPLDIKVDKLNKKKFMDWYEKNINSLSNYQSRHIVSSSIEEIGFFSSKLKFIDSSNVELLLDRIKRINMFIKIDNIGEEDIHKIQNEILNNLGIKDYNVYNYTPKNKIFENIFSENLYSSLDINDKNYILKNNLIDSQIYNNIDYSFKVKNVDKN
jgi:hypothetical protein